MSFQKSLFLVPFACILGIGLQQADAQKMYWTDPGAGQGQGKIQRSNLDGSDIEDVLTGLNGPWGIAIDQDVQQMYWTDAAFLGGWKIQRADLDGSNIEIVNTGNRPWAIALDTNHGMMYWTTGTDLDNGVRRANLDGQNAELIIYSGDDFAEGIALDSDNNKMYWVQIDSNRIRRTNLDGSNAEDLVSGLVFPAGIALDLIRRKMYWSDADASKIQRANLDGSNVENVLTELKIPWGITLDQQSGKIYFIQGAAGAGVPSVISRANLDGSNVEELVNGLETALYIALDLPQPNCDPEPVEWIDPPHRTVDARRPHPFFPCIDDQICTHPDSGDFEGINQLLVATPGENHLDCWRFLETARNPELHEFYSPKDQNDIKIIFNNEDGTHRVRFNRIITPAETTQVSYSGPGDEQILWGEFHSLPGDVDGNKTVCIEDVQELLDILKDKKQPVWGQYSADIDHSDNIHPADILQLIDLMNGAGAYEPWLGASIDVNNPTCLK